MPVTYARTSVGCQDLTPTGVAPPGVTPLTPQGVFATNILDEKCRQEVLQSLSAGNNPLLPPPMNGFFTAFNLGRDWITRPIIPLPDDAAEPPDPPNPYGVTVTPENYLQLAGNAIALREDQLGIPRGGLQQTQPSIALAILNAYRIEAGLPPRESAEPSFTLARSAEPSGPQVKVANFFQDLISDAGDTLGGVLNRGTIVVAGLGAVALLVLLRR